MSGRIQKGKADAPGAQNAVDLTIGVETLLVAGDDGVFRDFVADLFAAASGMQAVRRSLGKATGLTGSEIAMRLLSPKISRMFPVSHFEPSEMKISSAEMSTPREWKSCFATASRRNP